MKIQSRSHTRQYFRFHMNIIFIPSIKRNRRAEAYESSIASWKRWALNHNAQLIVMDELIYPFEEMKVTWQRYYALEMLLNSGITLSNSDQVLVIDNDTIINPNCPDFFKLTNMKWTGVKNQGSFQWVYRSIQHYKDMFDINIPMYEYLNGGFTIMNMKHYSFCRSITAFYHTHKEQLLEKQEAKLGTDQTPINYLRYIFKIDTTILPDEFNVQDLTRKDLLPIGQQWIQDTITPIIQSGWIYHLNAIPENPLGRYAGYFANRLWEKLK